MIWLLLVLATFLLSGGFLCWLIFAPLNEQIENQRRYRENIGRDYVRGSDLRGDGISNA